MAGTLKNYYEILGVSRSANEEQIKTAYRKLILKFHPDKNVGDSYFEDWSKKVIEAFEVLSDPILRAEYDTVYDEHKYAARQAATAAAAATVTPEPKVATNESSVETAVEEEPVIEEAFVDLDDIKEQLPDYLESKQAYFKAKKNYEAVVKNLPAVKKQNTVPVIIICLLLIGGSIAWIAKTASFKEKAIPANEDQDIAVNISQKFIVMAERAYFYKDPQNRAKTHNYLSKGLKIDASKKYKNFYYGVFQSKANPNYKLSGWVREEDLAVK